MKIVILYSGGLDSLIMKRYVEVYYPEADVKYLYYKHGADSEEQELQQLPAFVEVRSVDWLNEQSRPLGKDEEPQHGAIFIPGRNLVFAALAACQELPDEVWMGTLFDEVKPCSTDKNEHFRQHTSDLLSYVLSPFIGGVKVRFPFVEEKWSKVHSIAWALAHGVTPEELKASVSCWFHDGLPCGICMQCFRRYINFKLNGLEEQYRHHPLYHKRGKELLRLFLTQTPKNSDEENTVRIIREVTPLLDEPLQKLITDIQNEVV